jgi:hypothetical protein
MKLTHKHINLCREINGRGLGRGCSDLTKFEENMLSNEEWNEFCKAIWEWVKDPENYEEGRINVQDYMVVDFVMCYLIDYYTKNELKE